MNKYQHKETKVKQSQCNGKIEVLILMLLKNQVVCDTTLSLGK